MIKKNSIYFACGILSQNKAIYWDHNLIYLLTFIRVSACRVYTMKLVSYFFSSSFFLFKRSQSIWLQDIYHSFPFDTHMSSLRSASYILIYSPPSGLQIVFFFFFFFTSNHQDICHLVALKKICTPQQNWYLCWCHTKSIHAGAAVKAIVLVLVPHEKHTAYSVEWLALKRHPSIETKLE